MRPSLLMLSCAALLLLAAAVASAQCQSGDVQCIQFLSMQAGRLMHPQPQPSPSWRAPTVSEVDNELSEAQKYLAFLADLRSKLQAGLPLELPADPQGRPVQAPSLAELEQEEAKMRRYIEYLQSKKLSIQRRRAVIPVASVYNAPLRPCDLSTGAGCGFRVEPRAEQHFSFQSVDVTSQRFDEWIPGSGDWALEDSSEQLGRDLLLRSSASPFAPAQDQRPPASRPRPPAWRRPRARGSPSRPSWRGGRPRRPFVPRWSPAYPFYPEPAYGGVGSDAQFGGVRPQLQGDFKAGKSEYDQSLAPSLEDHAGSARLYEAAELRQLDLSAPTSRLGLGDWGRA